LRENFFPFPMLMAQCFCKAYKLFVYSFLCYVSTLSFTLYIHNYVLLKLERKRGEFKQVGYEIWTRQDLKKNVLN